MKPRHQRIVLFAALLAIGILTASAEKSGVFSAEGKTGKPVVYLLDIDGTINPALADHIIKGIEEAELNEASAFIIRIDTPGGVVSTTKTIIKSMINSKLPVVVYVAPSGSSATSAGALITLCADVAAMAPGTNIGAAHPVGGGGEDISGKMSEKVLNDLTAYVRGIVVEKGRNAQWAERTIRESVSATAAEALELGAIDVTADSVTELLDKIDGRTVKKKMGAATLKTKGAEVRKIAAGWRFKVLDVVANPNVAYVLMMIGGIGIMAELYSPGLIFPGVIGGISLLLAFFALQVLPVNHVGILLILLSVILFILEVKVASFGLLSIAAIISLTLGSIMLFDTGEAAMRVSLSVVIPTVAAVSGFFIFAMGLAVKAWLSKPKTGVEGLLGEVGTAITDIHRDGKADVQGEYWNARSESLLPKGEKVRVIAVEGLTLKVIRA
ncbi:MAG: nodulation protein NfeD [Pseudomonadota bacterium]